MNRAKFKTCQVKSKRRGALTVEFALTLPLVLVFFWGAFEVCRANILLHTIANACYEGARAGIVPGATANDARTAAQEVLRAVGTQGAEVVITPATLTLETEQVTVQISVPMDENSYVAPIFFRGKTLQKNVTLDREVMR